MSRKPKSKQRHAASNDRRKHRQTITNSAVDSTVRSGRRPRWVHLAYCLAAIGLISGVVAADYYRAPPTTEAAHFVGRQSCIACHQEEALAFQGSHHDSAMDVATEATVRGDFGDVTLDHHGITSRMFRDGERFLVHTEGPDGEFQDFEVKYVFGVEPLQQYMVEFDRTKDTPKDAIARLQVLRISWDTSRQKWFYLDPPDVTDKLEPGDVLHWTGLTQRWNTMCAECHSTNLEKHYDPKDQTYATTFSEIDVSCEACHGPGSTHVELANRLSLFWDRELGYGLTKLKTESNQPQIEACAPCHSRRGVIQEGFQAGDAYCDFYDPSPLSQALYFDDGQILDEVYVYGSFIQSKMYHKNIRCSDCHDPHSLKLKALGNQVCTSCHQHPAGKYNTPSHHKHVPGKPGSACVDCHMPERTYMEVDPRRDHSLRVPRPDLSVKLGTPNACTGCHLESENIAQEKREPLKEYANWLTAAQSDDEIAAEIDRANRWCNDACDGWYGSERQTPPHFAEVLAAFRSGEPNAARRLADLANDIESTPAIARATALESLGAVVNPTDLSISQLTSKEALRDPEPMVRAAAVRALAATTVNPQAIRSVAESLGPLLADESRLVRAATVRALVMTRAFSFLSPASKSQFQNELDRFEAAMEVTADRAGAHLEWGLMCESLGRINDAVAAYRTAMQVEPDSVGPRSNLSQLLDRILQTQIQSGQVTPEQVQKTQASISQLRSQELRLLERDAALIPENAQLQYRLGMAYYLNGKMEEAESALERAVELDPNEDFKLALRLLREKIGSGQ